MARKRKAKTEESAPRARGKIGVPPHDPPWLSWRDWVLKLGDIYHPTPGVKIVPLSEEWRQARRGRLTASLRIKTAFMRKAKSWNLMAEKIRHEMSPDYQWTEVDNVPALNWGRRYEPEAIANIELTEGEELHEPGLIFHPELPFVAATPDAMIDYGRVSVQIKCPFDSKIHLETLYSKQVPAEYFHQVMSEVWVTRAEAGRFYSYDPRQPLAARLVRVDVPRDQKIIDTYERNVRDFATFFCKGEPMGEGKLTVEGIPDVW